MNLTEFEALIAEHRPRAERLRGEDAAAEAVAYLWQRMDNFTFEKGVAAFYFKARCYSSNRRASAGAREHHERRAARGEMFTAPVTSESEGSPAVLKALASIGEDERAALLALVEHDSSHKLAADSLGLSVNNFRTLLQRAKRHMLRLLPKQD